MKELAKIFLFTKNEVDLLDLWIPYHGKMVGFHNLYICDHGSTNDVIKIYEKYKPYGIHLKDCSKAKFINKRKILSSLMREHKDDCHLVIPLDSDEFIAKYEGKGFSVKENEIRKCMEDLPIKNRRYKFNNFIAVAERESYSEPLLEMVKFVDNSHAKGKKKSFFPAKFFRSTDQGNHSGRVLADGQGKGGKVTPPIFTSLCLLHFEIRGLEQAVKKSRKGQKAYNFKDSKKPIVGRHWWSKLQHFNQGKEATNKWWEERKNRLLGSPYLITSSVFGKKLKDIKKEFTL